LFTNRLSAASACMMSSPRQGTFFSIGDRKGPALSPPADAFRGLDRTVKEGFPRSAPAKVRTKAAGTKKTESDAYPHRIFSARRIL
jgi:hypothetical protein